MFSVLDFLGLCERYHIHRHPALLLNLPMFRTCPQFICSVVHIGAETPSRVTSIGAPHMETKAGAKKRNSGPLRVISSASVPRGLPTKMFATAFQQILVLV